jgi:spore coat polysaccharide biosynthesis protein SpsF (cytidylyltransferase family)
MADDDAISEFCRTAGVRCFRGSMNDVTGRLIAAARSTGAEAFLRVCADSPLLDPALVDAIVGLFESSELDVSTNVHPRTFPMGFSVEAIRVSSLQRAQAMMRSGEEEHVTQVFYRCSESFRIANFASGHDWSSVKMSVDTQEDFALVERMILSTRGRFEYCGVAGLLALRRRCLEMST